MELRIKDKLVAWAERLGQLLEAMGWLYVSALVVAFGALWGFAELADEVLEQEFAAFNHQVLLAVQAHADPAWNAAVLFVTDLGSVVFILGLGAVVAAALVARGYLLDAATLAVALAGGGLLTYTLKLLFAQTRPEVFAPLAVETSYSFPSGHTLMSICLYGFLAAWLVARFPTAPWRWPAAAALGLLAVAISLSRIYLGVHWPTDVLAGALAAIFWLSVCLLGRGWFAARLRRRGRRESAAAPDEP